MAGKKPVRRLVVVTPNQFGVRPRPLPHHLEPKQPKLKLVNVYREFLKKTGQLGKPPKRLEA